MSRGRVRWTVLENTIQRERGVTIHKSVMYNNVQARVGADPCLCHVEVTARFRNQGRNSD